MNNLTLRTYRTERVLNIPFTCCFTIDILREMNEAIQEGQVGAYISITNTESVYHAIRIPSHLRYINSANFSCCDGIAVVLAGKLLGYKIPRLHGPDLMLECCEYGVDKKWRHFFYGGKKGVPELLTGKLTEKFPGLIVAGNYSPPFRELTHEEDRAVIDLINEANPDILWVGLGLLKQERWIGEHLGKIQVPWMIGVGAAFDFHAGTIKRAPKFFRNIGLEWLYRLAFEPRMLIRNLYSLTLFLKVFKERLRHRT